MGFNLDIEGVLVYPCMVADSFLVRELGGGLGDVNQGERYK